MAYEDVDYHAQRAAEERRLAECSGNPSAALAHLVLSRLHGERAAISRQEPATH